MSQEQRTATLATIFSEVLANLAFMFSDEVDADEPENTDRWLETEIGYQGPHCGALRFWCPRTFSVQLAGNLLGIGPDDDEAEAGADDAVKEFMNIVCGQLITAIHGTDAVFDLTIPTLRELGEPPRFGDAEDAFSSTLVVDGQKLHLRYEPGPDSAAAL